MKIEVIQDINRLNELKDDWDNLLEKSSSKSIFLTWEWIRNWWEIFHENNELLIILGYNVDNILVGIAPLMKSKNVIFGFNLKTIQFIGSGNGVIPEYLSFIVIPEFENNFVKRVLTFMKEIRKEWDIIRLSDMSEDNALLSNVQNISDKRNKLDIIELDPCPYIQLSDSWEGYSKNLSKKFRYNTARSERIFISEQKGEFAIYNDHDSLAFIIDRMEEIHKERMMVKKTIGISSQPIFWRFLKKIAIDFQKKDWIMLGALKSDGHVVACQYTLKYNNKAYFYQIGLDPAYGKYSLGSILIANMIKESIKRGLREYDFLRGNEDYKFHWTKYFRKNMELIIWNNNIRAKITSTLFNIKREVKKLIKNSFKIINTISKNDSK